MLVLKRKEGQWVEIIHRSGDVIRLRVYDIQSTGGVPSRVNLAFDDAARNFEIRRPERRVLSPKSVTEVGDAAEVQGSDQVESTPVFVAEAAIAIAPEGGFGVEGIVQEGMIGST